MTAFLDTATTEKLIHGVKHAGECVLAIYRRGFDVEIKRDNSPLTEADMASHHALIALLEEVTPETPILSEESGDIPFETRRAWERYWLIDPLDGTKEFIKRNDEFTLNVALIDNGMPVFGIVHAPAVGERGVTWWGQQGEGAWKQQGDEPVQRIQARTLPDPESETWKVVGSRSHGAAAFGAFCEGLPRHECVTMGSSLKLCLVAEGIADLYPRLAPTSEWDTAAAQAVVTAAGGEVLNAHTLEPLRCNQQDSVLNPFFIVCGQRDDRWIEALSTALSA